MIVLRAMTAMLAVASSTEYEPEKRSKCEPITIPLCRDMPYNVTRMPNIVEHETQEEAAVLLRQFTLLIDFNCSAQLRFFLCSLFAPLCSEMVDQPIPSCQSLCYEVKDKCLPLMQTVNLEWPQVLNCSRLPVSGREKGGALCMEHPPGVEAPSSASAAGRAPPLDTRHLVHKYPQLDWAGLLQGGAGAAGTAGVTGSPVADCPPPRYVRLQTAHRSVCRPGCGGGVLFTAADRQLAELWMTVWATLCFLSTLFTVLTFWIDTARFKYPERPIVFISMCYNIYSLGYLLRMVLGADHVICDVTPEGERYLIQEGLGSAGCIVTFLLLYYFGLASSLWWVVLTFTWFLSAGRKWSSEAIQRYATHLHTVAWGVPALLTIAIITAQTISGSELTGLCYVSSEPVSLLGRVVMPLVGLVIVPLALLLAAGALFLALGHHAFLRIRRRMRSDGTNTHKLETLMVRIGAYGLLYMVPATGVVACHVYEYVHWEGWQAAALAAAGRCPSGGAACPLQESIPPVAVFMVRLFMSLIVGVLSGMWVWTSKTGNSWHRLCADVCCGRRRHGTKSATYAPAPTAPTPALPLTSARPADAPPPRRPARTLGQMSRV